MRHIHDRNQTGKFFSQIVLHHAKDNLLKNMSKFQLACKPGHRPSEHLFVLKSVFTQYKQNKKGLLCTSYDISTFFDSEDVFDVFGEVYNNQVKGKVYRLLFEMNKNTRVKINTPVGVSQSADTGPIITQGGVEAGLLSSVSIDNGTNVTFAASDCEVNYFDIKLAPLKYQDDIFRMAETVASAQFSNDVLEDLFEKKSLSFNLSKSQFLIMGNRKTRKKLKSELEKKPLTLCGQEMEEAKALKYLGDYVSFDLTDSVHQTVLKRVSIVKHAMYEIRAVIEDPRAEKLGAIDLAFSIWETAVIPMLLHNADTWLDISKKTIKVLDNLFHSFCQKIFRVGVGCPIPSYYWQSGSKKFSILILQKKLNFVHHLANLSPDALGRQVWDLQVEKTLGLYSEVEEHLNAIGITDLRNVSKLMWKRTVKKYLHNLNKCQLLEEIRKYKKLNYDDLSKETFERKQYLTQLNLESARMRFRVSAGFVQTVRGNFSRKYRDKTLLCPGCQKITNDKNSLSQHKDTQPHILDCVSYSDLRGPLFDPSDDKMLAEFFSKVVMRRIENGDD